MTAIRLTERLGRPAIADAMLSLDYDLRRKSRFRAVLEDGREAAVHLPRGGPALAHGDVLAGADGCTVRIIAAAEAVSTVRADSRTALARAAYHLGNRHVPLEVGDGWLRYRSDHVLDGMVRGFGLEVVTGLAPFQPEPGAYAGGHHAHDHAPARDHPHEHA